MVAMVPVAVFCTLAVASALCVVLLQKPVRVALSLLAHSLSMAALYLTLDAQFAAVAQTLIYSGAIVVLFLIVVALLPAGGGEGLAPSDYGRAALVFAALVAVLGMLFVTLLGDGSGTSALPRVAGEAPLVRDVGAPLFGALVVPFELTAPLLLAAMVAAIALWRRQEAAR